MVADVIVVIDDAGSPRDQTTAFYEATVSHGYMGWGKTTHLDLGLGLMQGAKLARPDWDCINIMGDAATGMDLETGARNNIGTTTVVLKNSIMGGYIDYHPTAAQKFAIDELGGDYADLASALGCHAEVEPGPDPAEVAPALKRALAKNADGVPLLVEVISSDEGRIPRMLLDSL